MPATVLVLGTLDTKGVEHAFLRDTLRQLGCAVVLADVGVAGTPTVAAEIRRDEIAGRAGTTIVTLNAARDRGKAVAAMGRGAAALAAELHAAGGLHGVLAAGGSGGSSIATAAMRALPIGLPKLMVSMIASGDVGPYVGESDIAMLFAVLDVAGLNPITRRILENAATATAAMAERFARGQPGPACRVGNRDHHVRRHYAGRRGGPALARGGGTRCVCVPRQRRRRPRDGEAGSGRRD